MPWQEATKVSLRRKFVALAVEEGANRRAVCREFRISPTTGYAWLARFRMHGEEGLRERSRRPQRSPNKTPATMEQEILQLRDTHPSWGGRKIKRRLEDLGVPSVPPPSTITDILHRHGLIAPEEGRKHRPWQRFEAQAPNALWQMDFKGYFALADGSCCHPLTVLDDHSRFCLGLRACPDEQRETVKDQLTTIFRTSGLPECFLVDNGPPWGTHTPHRLTGLGVWLVRVGIRVVHARSFHPQTIGKDERFHRTLKAEVIARHEFSDIAHAQHCFDPWREVYNRLRPHQALGMAVPSSRYRESSRSFPETLAPILYNSGDIVRQVDDNGKIAYRGRTYRVGKPLRGHPVALRPTEEDGLLQVFFCHHRLVQIDLRGHNARA